MSASRVVLDSIPNDLRYDPTFDLNLDVLLSEKTLGVLLNWQEDVFVFRLNIQPGSKTYRFLLSNVCALNDPLGFS